MINRVLPPVHPGEYLREEYLSPLALSPYALAKKLHIPRTRIERLVAEITPVTPDTAIRLAKYFGTSPEFWLGLQSLYDLTILEQTKQAEIAAIEVMDAA